MALSCLHSRTPRLQTLVCILYQQHISSHFSSAQQPRGAHGRHVGQCISRLPNTKRPGNVSTQPPDAKFQHWGLIQQRGQHPTDGAGFLGDHFPALLPRLQPAGQDPSLGLSPGAPRGSSRTFRTAGQWLWPGAGLVRRGTGREGEEGEGGRER